MFLKVNKNRWQKSELKSFRPLQSSTQLIKKYPIFDDEDEPGQRLMSSSVRSQSQEIVYDNNSDESTSFLPASQAPLQKTKRTSF